MAIDDAVVKLEFEGREARVIGKPGTPPIAKNFGGDYYLAFLLKGMDEQGGETFYAGFRTAKIDECEGGRTYFSPVNLSGIYAWVLYVGDAGGMGKANAHRVTEDPYVGCSFLDFGLGEENYALTVPHSRGKPAVLFDRMGRHELEILLTLNEAQNQAIRAYMKGKADQETERI